MRTAAVIVEAPVAKVPARTWFDRWIWDRGHYRYLMNQRPAPPGSSPKHVTGWVRYVLPINTNLIWFALLAGIAAVAFL